MLPSFKYISIGLPVDCELTLRAYLVVLGIEPKDLNMPNQLPVAVIKLSKTWEEEAKGLFDLYLQVIIHY